MTISMRHSHSTLAPARKAARTRRAKASRNPVAEATTAQASATTLQQRIRFAGGPCDIALYQCSGCGGQFDAEVSAAVSCPRCGADQSW